MRNVRTVHFLVGASVLLVIMAGHLHAFAWEEQVPGTVSACGGGRGQRSRQAVLLLTQNCLNIWSLSQAGALFVLDVGVELVLLELLAENAVWCGAVRCAHESTFCDYAMRIRCNLTGI